MVIFLVLPMTPLQAIIHTKPNGSIGQYANQACRNALFRQCTCQQSCILLEQGTREGGEETTACTAAKRCCSSLRCCNNESLLLSVAEVGL